MAHVIREFNWVLHPIVVLGPDSGTLKNFFEEIAFELTTELGGGESLGLRSFSVLGPGALSFWMSATLGKRGKGVSRMSVMGLSLEGDIKEISRVLALVDGGILLASQDHPNFDKFFNPDVAQALKRNAWVFYSPEKDPKSLRLKALRTWLGEKSDKVFWNPRKEKVLEDSLTWILEESP